MNDRQEAPILEASDPISIEFAAWKAIDMYSSLAHYLSLVLVVQNET